MLPDFPKVKAKRMEIIHRRALSNAMGNHPVLTMLRGRAVPEGDDYSFTSIDGRHDESGYEHLEAKGEIDAREVRYFDDDRWVEKCAKDLMGPIVDQQMDLFLRMMNRVTASTGNVINGKGRPLPETMLEMLEKIGFSFDDSGNPQLPTMLVGKEMYDRVMALGEPTDEFKRSQQEIIDRKRIAWRFEQADRKLVD